MYVHTNVYLCELITSMHASMYVCICAYAGVWVMLYLCKWTCVSVCAGSYVASGQTLPLVSDRSTSLFKDPANLSHVIPWPLLQLPAYCWAALHSETKQRENEAQRAECVSLGR